MNMSKACWFCFGAITGSALFGVFERVEFVSGRGVKPTLKAQFSKIETAVQTVDFSEGSKGLKDEFKAAYSRFNFRPMRTLIDGKEELVTFLLNPDVDKWIEHGLPHVTKRPLIGAIIHGGTNTLAVYYSDRHITYVPCAAHLLFSIASNEFWNSNIDCFVNSSSVRELDQDVGF